MTTSPLPQPAPRSQPRPQQPAAHPAPAPPPSHPPLPPPASHAVYAAASDPHAHAHAHDPALAPTKASLKTWWNHFNFAQRVRREAEEKKAAAAGPEAHAVFGRPLKESLKAASVQISTANANGELYVWGYIPVVVAKWCVFPCLFSPASPFPAVRPMWAHGPCLPLLLMLGATVDYI